MGLFTYFNVHIMPQCVDKEHNYRPTVETEDIKAIFKLQSKLV